VAGSVIGSVLELTDSVCDAFNLTPRDTSREERKADEAFGLLAAEQPGSSLARASLCGTRLSGCDEHSVEATITSNGG